MWSDNSDAQDGVVRVTVGVDTHTDQHVGVALDQFGRRLGTRSVPTTPAGFAALWTFDRVACRYGSTGTAPSFLRLATIGSSRRRRSHS